jgi:hypothetical protein
METLHERVRTPRNANKGMFEAYSPENRGGAAGGFPGL